MCIYIYTHKLPIYILYIYIHAGWWYTYPSEKYEFVSWDDYSHILWTNKSHVIMFQATNQYIYIVW